MKILVIAGDYWHPMEVVRRGIEEMELDGDRYQCTFVEDAKDIVTVEMLNEHDLVIFAKANVVTPLNTSPMFGEGQGALSVEDYRSYVAKGGGLLSLHAGNTVGLPAWNALVGNHFIKHPPCCPVHVYPTKEHPILQGASAFTACDEHYELGGIAEDIDIFLQSDSQQGGTQIAGYTRLLEKGRVCVLTPGHTMASWREPAFRRIFQNALDWCCRRM